MNTQNCKFEEKCKYFLPKGIKDFRTLQETNVHERNKFSNVNNVDKFLQYQVKPTKHTYQNESPYFRQESQMKNPF